MEPKAPNCAKPHAALEINCLKKSELQLSLY